MEVKAAAGAGPRMAKSAFFGADRRSLNPALTPDGG